MAVAAAVIAATIAHRTLKHTKRRDEDERWWDTLTWVYDRTVVEKEKRAPLPPTITLSMLSALNKSVTAKEKDRLQGQAISSILSMFEGSHLKNDDSQQGEESATLNDADSGSSTNGKSDANPRDSTGMKSNDPEQNLEEPTEAANVSFKVFDPGVAALARDLRDNLSSKGFDPPQIPWNPALVYEYEVMAALNEIAKKEGVILGGYEAESEIDAIMSRPPRVAFVLIKWLRGTSAMKTKSELIKSVKRIRATYPNVPLLIVSNSPLVGESAAALERRDITEPITHLATWRSSRDDRKLRESVKTILPNNDPPTAQSQQNA
ncbi:hypothetical protein GCM10025331_64650 [Actinoplanes utahensis]|nr:hypothetical protein Aut01nite_42190 [Actinoplanes utahensis]